MHPKTILSIDDDRTTIRVIEAVIASLGYRIISAYDAEVGILLAKQQQPDLILMDLDMPGLDGFEATFNLKRNPKTLDIPVIILSGRNDEDDIAKAQEVGCDEFITKPVRVHELRTVLNRHLTEEVN